MCAKFGPQPSSPYLVCEPGMAAWHAYCAAIGLKLGWLSQGSFICAQIWQA